MMFVPRAAETAIRSTAKSREFLRAMAWGLHAVFIHKSAHLKYFSPFARDLRRLLPREAVTAIFAGSDGASERIADELDGIALVNGSLREPQ